MPADTDVVIVGGGLAGLAAARRLHRAGTPWRLIEAADRLGGRVATDEVDGYLLDRGFQVLNTAYPRLGGLVDLGALKLGWFTPGVLVRRGDRRGRRPPGQPVHPGGPRQRLAGRRSGARRAARHRLDVTTGVTVRPLRAVILALPIVPARSPTRPDG
ncbi:Pseudooxynicotine oxidase [Micromonospora sp. MH33]|nr:Pseudooxynicotine oxidase [Micromonospora sp. MH33]